MPKPILKQFGDLNERDLMNHPVWVCVHGVDEQEPWYGETDEVTYRPYETALPYDRLNTSSPRVVARTDFVFANGTSALGLITPHLGSNEYGTTPAYTQPQVFIPKGGSVSFYDPLIRFARQSQQQLREWLNEGGHQLFPLRYRVADDIVTPTYEGVLNGFYYLEDGKEKVL